MSRKQKYDYFEAFEQLAELTISEADLLIETIQSFSAAEELKDAMQRAHDIEHEGDNINHDIYHNVATDFITPIDREDIIEMASSLDNIIDYIEDVMQRFYMYDIHFMHNDALEFAQLVRKGCGALSEAMKETRKFKRSEKFHQLVIEVNTYEEEADALLMKVIHDLHTIDRDKPMRVLVWSQIFNRLEKCSDATEHASDVMSTILLKNV